jgi:diguanylate cyclase (GGDEF)-like protein
MQLVIIFAIPSAFYLFCNLPLDPDVQSHPFASAIAFSYYLVPFTVLTAISIFPLTLLEASCFAAPLLIIYTVANFYWPRVHSPLSGMGALWVMTSVAGISILVSMSQLQLLIKLVVYAAYDSLTNCLSRRSGEEIVKTLWSYSVRNKRNLTIAFIDMDHFRAINDEYGHRMGDKMLAAAAASIKKVIRESDFVIRWGGEEFLIIMYETDMDNAIAGITRMCRAGFGKLPNGKMQTASVGIAERIADDAQDSLQLIELADQRLYQAKTAGRNCCIGSKIVMLR